MFRLTAETPFSNRLELHMFQAAAEMARERRSDVTWNTSCSKRKERHRRNEQPFRPAYPSRMDDATVRERAQAMCEAIVAGDVDTATADASPELRRNLGEVIGLFPLPATEASIESITQGGSSFVVVLHLVGESDEVQIQTRWKDRDGTPTLVEASHLSRTERVAEAAPDTEDEVEPT
jgi:hypothetical protein